MATLSASTIIEINSAATAGNVNGGGFNPTNANVIADGAILNGTTAAPTISSVIGAFVAADVGAWIYLPSQSNINSGFYEIMSVAGGVATLSAAVGSTHVNIITNNKYGTNTVQGCATQDTVNNVNYLVDYSRGTSAIKAFTNLGSASGSTTLTDNSAGGFMRKTFAGNLINLNSGTNTTVGWYEIVSVTDTNNVVLNVTPHGANTMSATVGKIGGAISLGGSTASIDDNNVFSTLVVTSATAITRFFIKGSATYTLGVAVTTGSGNATWPLIIEGYNSYRGERPVDSTRPILAGGANAISTGGRNHIFSVQFTGTGTSVLSTAASSDGICCGCKSTNSSTTAGRAAFKGAGRFLSNEGISYRGTAFQAPTNATAPIGYFYNYAHDSNIGFAADTGATGSCVSLLVGNIIEGCVTYGFDTTGSSANTNHIIGNTFYGAENKLGTGLNIITADNNGLVVNNIFYGFATGIACTDVNASIYSDNNTFYNNTADINTANHYQKGSNDKAINPGFTSATQVTGTTAITTAGNHLVDSGASFITAGVTAGRDYLYVISGTGVTAGVYGISSVDSATQITTDITLAADATANKVYQITSGHNFAINTNLKALGYPGAFPAALSTGYLDIGAVQRQESGTTAATYSGLSPMQGIAGSKLSGNN